MAFVDFIAQIETQASLMRSAALKAGPDAPVPSCPEWTVLDLVRRVSRKAPAEFGEQVLRWMNERHDGKAEVGPL